MTHTTAKLIVTKELKARFNAYYSMPENGVWGSMHIVLDDRNLENHSVDFCIKLAKERGDKEGHELALILRRLSKTQRGKIAKECGYYYGK